MTLDRSFDPDDSPPMPPEARLREVAAILAAGLIRLRERASLASERAGEESEKLVQNPLEEPG